MRLSQDSVLLYMKRYHSGQGPESDHDITDKAEWHRYTEKTGNSNNINREA